MAIDLRSLRRTRIKPGGRRGKARKCAPGGFVVRDEEGTDASTARAGGPSSDLPSSRAVQLPASPKRFGTAPADMRWSASLHAGPACPGSPASVTSDFPAHLDWFHRYLGGAPSPYDPKALVANDVFGKEKEEKKEEAAKK